MKDAFFQSLIKEFLSDRIDTMIRSLKCLFKYPLLGIVGESGLDREAILSEVGQHSYFMDTFAFYGCLVGFFAIINYFFLFKKTYFKGNAKQTAPRTKSVPFYLKQHCCDSPAGVDQRKRQL